MAVGDQSPAPEGLARVGLGSRQPEHDRERDDRQSDPDGTRVRPILGDERPDRLERDIGREDREGHRDEARGASLDRRDPYLIRAPDSLRAEPPDQDRPGDALDEAVNPEADEGDAAVFAGCFVAFAGATIIGVATSGSPAASPDATLGIVLCLGAAVLYGIGVTVQKPVTASTPALTLTFWTCVIGAITCAPFASGLIQEVRAAQPASIGWAVYLGLFPTAIAFTTWAYALTHTTAGRLGSTSYLVPAVAIVLGWLILGETPPALALVGGVLALGGVVIAHWTPARSRRALARGGAT